MNRAKRSTVSAAAAFRPDSLIDAHTRIGDLAVRCGDHAIALNSQASDLALAELSLRQRARLRVAEHPLSDQWQQMADFHFQRNLEILEGWWEITARTQDALLTAMRDCLAPQAADLEMAERRQRSVVINFPDRRQAA